MRGATSRAPSSAGLTAARMMLGLLWLAALALPVWIFWNVRGGADALRGLDAPALGRALFPLAGLVAFSLVWSQLIIGANLWWLRRVFPTLVRFHRTQGVFTLLFALLHPLLLLLGVGLTTYLARTFVPQRLVSFVWMGYAQLFLLLLTAGTAMLRRLPFLRRSWRTIHLANYAVFALVWLHGWSLGTDVQPTVLRFVWMAFALTAAASVIGRVVFGRRERTAPPRGAAGAGHRLVGVGALSDFAEERPYCRDAGSTRAVLVRRGQSVFALENACTHADGPLCEGTYRDGVITCPLHGSLFRVMDGAVLSGPARIPQPAFKTRVQDGIVYLASFPQPTLADETASRYADRKTNEPQKK